MPARSPLAPFLEPLERLGLPYCITGSVAASVYEQALSEHVDRLRGTGVRCGANLGRRATKLPKQ